MAPQFGPGSGQNPQNPSCFNSNEPGCNLSNGITDPTTSPDTQLNIPMLVLGLALAAFLVICFLVCACTYRNARARSRTIRRRPVVPRKAAQGHSVGLGLGLALQDRAAPVVIMKDEEEGDGRSEHLPPPAYSPKPSGSSNTSTSQHRPANLTLAGGSGCRSPSPLLSLAPSPALAAPVSPAFSSYSLSPALSQGEDEEARLLGARRALTPPPPTYVR